MKDEQQHLEALKDIRQMMKESNRFLSLSGFSGICAGVYALAGVYFAYESLNKYRDHAFSADPHANFRELIMTFAIISSLVLGLSLCTAIYFSKRKADKLGHRLFDHTTWRLVINMLIPLATGGLYCLALLSNGYTLLGLISPAMLIFYGLALVNGSKYTLHELRALGCLEILLGLIACFYMEFGLVLWAIGFGVLHIIYGTYMWFKYERN